MRKSTVVALVLLGFSLALSITVIAQNYQVAKTYNVGFSSVWNAALNPTSYSRYSSSFTATWYAILFPAPRLVNVLSFVSTWYAIPIPSPYMERALSFASTWYAIPAFRLPTFYGSMIDVEQTSGGYLKLDKYFWDGGVWIDATAPATLLVKTDRELYLSQGSVSKTGDGYVVSIPAGKTLMAEKCRVAVVDLIDPLGSRKFGIDLVMKTGLTETSVEPYVLYEVPMHTDLWFEMRNAEMGSVYLNGTKVKLPVFLANATNFRFTIVVKGTAIAQNVTAKMEGKSDYVRLFINGRVVDSTFYTPVGNALVKAYVEGSYAGYAITLEDGYFVVDTFVKRPKGGRAKVNLEISHDDYKTFTVTTTTTVPAVSPFEEIGGLTIPSAILGVILAASMGTVLLKLGKSLRRQRKFVSKP